MSGRKIELCMVEWFLDDGHWEVSARTEGAYMTGDPWSTFVGNEGELADLLALAHDVMTGG